ncbi:uncharacterized protein OCT59_026189 [Rhizophagus irregularis]|uniref:uncharacterized protein n=1 Tax=Rhizophagus irregularis TaxID=588596 RepID=UPI0033188DF4|nr:hypothetical protein OCT59_026189 [Rhizophagus irregularis]
MIISPDSGEVIISSEEFAEPHQYIKHVVVCNSTNFLSQSKMSSSSTLADSNGKQRQTSNSRKEININ